jgi:hypothetical protein
MPPYTIDLLPDEPIIVQVMGKEYQVTKHLESSASEIGRLLDTASEPLTLIVDLREASLGLDDIIGGANAAARMSGLFKHPNLRKTILITSSRLIELAARGMNTPIFGHMKMEVSKTVEEALAVAHQ